ncbi:MAG TPA: prepilin-type N-terminal cleavage/methylation domain-containing protein [Steroidobacteraceae bacterium]|nr:prepilin-type N-terminal cleavage/methylation domain-containing protein [Steroidobacteraceae bacterium]
MLACPQFSRSRARSAAGFTLLELMMVGVVAGVLLAIAVPSYRKIIEHQRVVACIADLGRISMELEKYRTQHGDFPDSLSELSGIPQQDPWGHPYQFLNFNSNVPGINGKIRKDHNLHPLNSEFDLYSMGADGKSVPPLTAKASRDDVIWARDGSFIGLASDY